MNNLPESTFNLILSGVMGLFGGILALPINTFASWWLTQEELRLKSRLNIVEKKQELLLSYKLERKHDKEIANLKEQILNLENELAKYSNKKAK